MNEERKATERTVYGWFTAVNLNDGTGLFTEAFNVRDMPVTFAAFRQSQIREAMIAQNVVLALSASNEVMHIRNFMSVGEVSRLLLRERAMTVNLTEVDDE
jgi:uncharacterized membrane protein (DUF4010 family)